MSTYYLAGPMRGYEEFNFPAFHAAAKRLRRYGYGIISPAEMDLEKGLDPTIANTDAEAGFDVADALRRDTAAIADPGCDGVVLLPGWEASKGANAEKAFAEAIGKHVCFYNEAPGLLSETDPARLLFPRCAEDHEESAASRGADAFVARIRDEAASRPGRPLTEEELTSGLDAENIVPLRQATLADAPANFGEGETVRLPQGSIGRILAEQAAAFGGEYVVTDPGTGGRKGRKPERTDLLPFYALRLLAEHYGRGAEKYDDHNWRKGYAWSLSYGALLRHLFAWLNGEDRDPETGSLHTVAVAWHALALVEFQALGLGTDDRWVAP